MRLASGARALHIVIEAFIEAYACISYRHRRGPINTAKSSSYLRCQSGLSGRIAHTARV